MGEAKRNRERARTAVDDATAPDLVAIVADLSGSDEDRSRFASKLIAFAEILPRISPEAAFLLCRSVRRCPTEAIVDRALAIARATEAIALMRAYMPPGTALPLPADAPAFRAWLAEGERLISALDRFSEEGGTPHDVANLGRVTDDYYVACVPVLEQIAGIREGQRPTGRLPG